MWRRKKTGGGQDNRGRWWTIDSNILPENHQADRIEDWQERAVTQKTASGSWNSPCPQERPLLKNSSDTEYVWKRTVEQTFQRERLYSPTIYWYVRGAALHTIDNSACDWRKRRHINARDQHWVTEQGIWNGIAEGTDKAYLKRKSGGGVWVRQQLDMEDILVL